ncbi:unnamed protein product, partial [marine sediment metagenome]
ISGLSPNTYNATITVTAPGASNTPRTVGVTLTVSGQVPTIGVSPLSFGFNAMEGGTNPTPQALSISNPGTGTLSWSLSDDAAWLNLSPLSGTCTTETDTVTLAVDIFALAIDTYNATITITDPSASNSPVDVSVTLVVWGAEIWVAKDGDDVTGNGTVGDPYATITKALEVVFAGGTIRVKPGAYTAPLTITLDNITLVSTDGRDATTINGGGTGGAVIDLGLHDGITIEGFFVTDGCYGIDADYCAGLTIRQCK